MGSEIHHFEAERRPLTEAEMANYLLHEDGWMRVPVLLDGSLLVRGYTETLYEQALGGRRGGQP